MADRLGPMPETVRLWVRRAEVDGGARLGVASAKRDSDRCAGVGAT